MCYKNNCNILHFENVHFKIIYKISVNLSRLYIPIRLYNNTQEKITKYGKGTKETDLH